MLALCVASGSAWWCSLLGCAVVLALGSLPLLARGARGRAALAQLRALGLGYVSFKMLIQTPLAADEVCGVEGSSCAGVRVRPASGFGRRVTNRKCAGEGFGSGSSE